MPYEDNYVYDIEGVCKECEKETLLNENEVCPDCEYELCRVAHCEDMIMRKYDPIEE